MSKSEDWISIQPESTYREVTVRLWGKGVTVRRECLGAEIKSGRRLRVQRGQFILSRIDARNGAFGLIPDELDVLLKHRDGKFTGHQIKTRESDQAVWKASDPQVKSACARFVQLERDFPGHFRAYRFLTSHPLHVAQNAQGLGHILSNIASAATIADLSSSVKGWLRTIATDANTSEAIAFQALKKTTASDDLPKLRDSFMRLVETLTTSWSGAGECSHESVRRAAQALVDECARASALNHEQTLPTYILAVNQPEVEIAACINGKQLTPDRVRETLTGALNSMAMLSGDPVAHAEPGKGSTDLMLKKLDAGGFSAVSRNSAEDLRDKADYLGIAWTKQHGRRKGLERYAAAPGHHRLVAIRQ